MTQRDATLENLDKPNFIRNYWYMMRFLSGLIGLAFVALNVAQYNQVYVPDRFDLLGVTWNTAPVTLAAAVIFLGGAIWPLAAAGFGVIFAAVALLFDFDGKWILAPSALALATLFLFARTQGLRYYCGDCGQALGGNEPTECPRCGYNRFIMK